MLAAGLACYLLAAAPPSAKSTDSPEARARTLATEAKERFDAGDFLKAAEALEQAVALTPTPALLYNLGRAYQQAGKNEPAIDAYQRYLEAAPAAPNQRAVEETIATLQNQLDAQRALEQQLASERERAEARERELEEARTRQQPAIVGAEGQAARAVSPLPWVVLALGAAATGAASVFAVLAQQQHQSAVGSPTADGAFALQKTALTYAGVANGLFIGGPLVAVAGLIWGVIDLKNTRSAPVALGFTGNGFALCGAWP